MTAASWMRRFVDRHPDYQHDSNLPQSTVYDLIECCDALAESRLHCPQFLPRTSGFIQHSAVSHLHHGSIG